MKIVLIKESAFPYVKVKVIKVTNDCRLQYYVTITIANAMHI